MSAANICNPSLSPATSSQNNNSVNSRLLTHKKFSGMKSQSGTTKFSIKPKWWHPSLLNTTICIAFRFFFINFFTWILFSDQNIYNACYTNETGYTQREIGAEISSNTKPKQEMRWKISKAITQFQNLNNNDVYN